MVKTINMRKATNSKSMGLPRSLVSSEDLGEMQRKYANYGWRIPSKSENAMTPSQGELCLFQDHFRAGLVLPLPKFMVVPCKYFRMLPAMFTPNSITMLLGLYQFFVQHRVEWTAGNIMSMLSFVTKEAGVYYIQVRHSQAFGMTGTVPNAYHNWRSRYFFVKDPTHGWEIPTAPEPMDPASLKKWPVSSQVKKLYKDIGHPYFTLNVVTLELTTSKLLKRKAEEAGESTPQAKKTKKKLLPSESSSPSEASEESESSGSDDEEASEGSSSQEESQGLEKEEISAGEGNTVPAADSVQVRRRPGKEVASTVAAPDGEDQPPADDDSETAAWFCERSKNLVLKKNKDMRYIGDHKITEVPAAVLECLISPQDEEELDKYQTSELADLQAYYSFASAMVARRMDKISAGRLNRYRGERAKYEKILASNEKLNIDNRALEDELVDLKKSSSEEKKRLSVDKEALAKEVEELRNQLALSKKGQKEAETRLSTELVSWSSQKLTLEDQKAALQLQVTDLSAKLETATAASATPALTLEAATQMYKASPGFQWDMKSYGEDGFCLMKDALVVDGIVSREVVNSYDFLSCMQRDIAGEFQPSA